MRLIIVLFRWSYSDTVEKFPENQGNKGTDSETHPETQANEKGVKKCVWEKWSRD